MTAAPATGREPRGDEAWLARRTEAVRARLSRRLRFERSAMLLAGLLVGVAAQSRGFPAAASALLASCAAVALLALIDAPAPTVQGACAWLDMRLGRRTGTAAALWQSAVAALPPFRARLAREAAQADDGSNPLPLRRGSAAVLVATLAVVVVATVGGRADRPAASSDVASDALARGSAAREPGPRGVSMPVGGTGGVDTTVRTGDPGRDLAAASTLAATSGGAPTTFPPSTGTTTSAPAVDPGGPDRLPQGGRALDGALAAPEARVLLRGDASDLAAERMRTRGGDATGAPGAQGGEGVGDAAASRDDRSFELPVAPAAPRAVRVGAREGSLDEPAAVRDRIDAPPPVHATASTSSIRPTPLMAGRWALTAAEQSYLLRWSRLRDPARTPPVVDGPPSPGGTDRPRREGR